MRRFMACIVANYATIILK